MTQDERQHPEILRIKRGERIFSQGESGDAAYLLETGRVSIHQVVDGHPLELDAVEPGEIFGEMAVLDGGKRMATATAAEDSVVARLRTGGFNHRLESADRFLRALVMLVVKNIRASHRVFLRRPRSFRDHVRQMTALSGNLRRFSSRMPDRAEGASLAEALDQLDTALSGLHALSARCYDQRHDIILDAKETDGVGLDQVVGSEARRRVFSARRPER